MSEIENPARALYLGFQVNWLSRGLLKGILGILELSANYDTKKQPQFDYTFFNHWNLYDVSHIHLAPFSWDPKKRFTPEEALNHQFLAVAGNNNNNNIYSIPNNKLSDDLLSGRMYPPSFNNKALNRSSLSLTTCPLSSGSSSSAVIHQQQYLTTAEVHQQQHPARSAKLSHRFSFCVNGADRLQLQQHSRQYSVVLGRHSVANKKSGGVEHDRASEHGGSVSGRCTNGRRTSGKSSELGVPVNNLAVSAIS